MSDVTIAGEDRREPGSQLRHDLITPINLILGYADLLIDDVEAPGQISRDQGLRSIQQLGRAALLAIDETLIAQPGPATQSRPDLESMATRVALYSRSIVESCEEIERVSGTFPGRSRFVEDLARVRTAAIELEMIVRRASDEHRP